MVPNWRRFIEPLRAAMLEHGARLPTRPLVDARWHQCGLTTAAEGSAWYLIFPTAPRAIYTSADGQPRIWRPDDRVLTRAAELQLAQAIARLPRQAARPPSRSVLPNGPIADAGTRSAAVRSKREARAESAKAFLASVLAAGPVATREIKVRAREAGLAWSTVRRAQDEMGVLATRTGFGAAGRWSWRLKALSSEEMLP